MTAPMHELILVPWHIGNRLDITVNTARVARKLRVFLAEDPELTKRQFESDLGIDCRGKEFILIPEKEDGPFLKNVLASLLIEDVGMISSGGIPCFIDPGAWLVGRLRSREVPITALAGPSILSTMLSLSAVDWTGAHNRGSFVIYLAGGNNEVFLEAVGRDREPVFVFLNIHQFRECFSVMRPVLGGRPVSAFFDLTKNTKGKYPYADRVMTMGCGEWLKQEKLIAWKEISDVALMIHPGPEAP